LLKVIKILFNLYCGYECKLVIKTANFEHKYFLAYSLIKTFIARKTRHFIVQWYVAQWPFAI